MVFLDRLGFWETPKFVVGVRNLGQTWHCAFNLRVRLIPRYPYTSGCPELSRANKTYSEDIIFRTVMKVMSETHKGEASAGEAFMGSSCSGAREIIALVIFFFFFFNPRPREHRRTSYTLVMKKGQEGN